MSEAVFHSRLRARQKKNARLRAASMFGALMATVFLVVLIASIINESFGYVIMDDAFDRTLLERGGTTLEAMNKDELVSVVREHLSPRRLRAVNRGSDINALDGKALYDLVIAEIVQPRIQKTYTLYDSVFKRGDIARMQAEQYPQGLISFRRWINYNFLTSSQTSDPMTTGVYGALIGSLLVIVCAFAIAFPVGIATALWLHEYASSKRFARLVTLNIHNLAGVPSILYGMLGLAVFVRVMEPITSGSIFGKVDDINGRTIISAGLTIGMLILPVIIINAQEALRAVPASLRHASLALGATAWQTTWHHVLPTSLDRIITGTLLAVSRGIGETAPLVIAGASTFLTKDPTGIFSQYTTLPIQIYQWSARPQPEYRHIAAAAILALLVLMLTLSISAIIARNTLRARKEW